MSKFLLSPKVDFCFKEIMRNDKARLGFISAVLHIDPTTIKETRILNTELQKEFLGDKQGIVDVHVLLDNEVEIDIEIQIAPLNIWPERSLFYWSKMYAGHIEAGGHYSSLKKCISISILGFVLFPEVDRYYFRFHLTDDWSRTLFTDKMEFHVIELPKLPLDVDKTDDKDSLLLWAQFINAKDDDEFETLASKNDYINSAYTSLQQLSLSGEKRYEYEARQKVIRDYNEGMYEARRSGIAEGFDRGTRESTFRIAKQLLDTGMSVEQVASITELPLDQVSKLSK